jgi:hypothetical protein
VPAFADSVTTLDLRYNSLDLSDANKLNPISSHSALRELWLHGNPSLAGAPDLKGLAGMVLRVDLTPVGLDQAEAAADMPTAIEGIVKALHYLPLEIYDYVLNNYAFQYYFGLTKGSLGTIRTKAGNDFDLSQLLIDLLKEMKPDIDAEIVGTFVNTASSSQPGGIAIPIADAARWLGVKHTEIARAILNTAGPNAASPEGQTLRYPSPAAPTHFVASHVWVKASLPGFADTPLDPSWKLPELSINAKDFLGTSAGQAYLNANLTHSFNLSNLSQYNPVSVHGLFPNCSSWIGA